MSIWIKGSGGPWTMADELTFIGNIGTWRDSTTLVTTQDKISLLQGYKQGLALRSIWVNLIQHELLARADTEIARLTAAAKPKPVTMR